MNIKDLAKKHNFKKDVDYWQHKQSGQWILKHDAITKIANAENIKLIKIESLYQSDICVRFLVTMGLLVDDNFVNQITSVGEADTNSCFMPYLGCIAEKRGIDRCVLKLINAYEYGISSEEEAEDYKQEPVSKPAKTTNQQVTNIVEKYDGEVIGDDVEPKIKNIINFGKHRGIEWKDVPEDYINWVSKKSNVEWQREEADKELERRKGYTKDAVEDIENKQLSNKPNYEDEENRIPF